MSRVIHGQMWANMLVKAPKNVPFEAILNAHRCAKTSVAIRNTSQPMGRCPELVIECAATTPGCSEVPVIKLHARADLSMSETRPEASCNQSEFDLYDTLTATLCGYPAAVLSSRKQCSLTL
eukprot:6212475-Pleurochrysis_carterae.AAC.3